MTAAAVSEPKTTTSPISSPAGNAAPLEKISWKNFEKEYLTREDGFRYEWSDGKVIKTPRAMNQYQYFILDNLTELFTRLRFAGKVSGKMYAEIDTFFLKKHHRRPDMAWFSDEQAARMAYRENQIPKFVIEIVSDHDKVDDLLDKLKDYKNANVEVVWVISPARNQVWVHSENSSWHCSGDQICSAAPVLPEFQITAEELFRKPAKPETVG